MLEIINQQGLILQVDSDTVVPVEVYNPLFNEDNELFQELIYSAQAGLTEMNIAFIKSGHLVEADSSVYEQPVRVHYLGAPFFAGTFRYKITDQKISFDLKVNFGSVATKMKNTVMRDIITQDSVMNANEASAKEALMKDSCLHPQDYPFAFFPVKNTGWIDTPNEITYPWMNFWDHANQKFKVVNQGIISSGSSVQVPFFKISYLISKIFEYLRFNLEGELLSDPEFNAVYLYTRNSLAFPILPSMVYVPDELTIGDFIKQIGQRMKLNFTYDLMNNSVTVDSPVTALNFNDVLDISHYVENIQEISIADAKGYTVTMKVDESDLAMGLAPEGAEDPIFKPYHTLVVGNGENVIEMEVSTLREFKDTDYSYPIASQLIGQWDVTTWPVRLLKFYGMKDVSGGKVFPQAYAYDLSEEDSTFYRFWNDSKKVIINAKIPPGVLAKYKPTTKFGFISAQGTYQRALNAKFSYSLPGTSTELISTKIECQTIVDDYDTPFSINEYVDVDSEGLPSGTRFNFCYQDDSQPSESLTVLPVPAAGSTAVLAALPAMAPADSGGVGGQPGLIYAISGSRRDLENYTIRIFDKKPLYAIVNGEKRLFTQVSNYYESLAMNPIDGRPVLIVF